MQHYNYIKGYCKKINLLTKVSYKLVLAIQVDTVATSLLASHFCHLIFQNVVIRHGCQIKAIDQIFHHIIFLSKNDILECLPKKLYKTKSY